MPAKFYASFTSKNIVKCTPMAFMIIKMGVVIANFGIVNTNKVNAGIY